MIGYGHTEEELENTLKVASEVVEYKEILHDPMLPSFPCPDNLNSNEYMRQLCRNGWKALVETRVDKSQHEKYRARVERELKVFEDAKLSGYFLICQDIINFVRRNNWLPGPGRGSAAGCLVSYLIGVTSIDPMPYNLLFERFYNAGRNAGGRISMPDIDMDVPVTKRNAVIDYIKRQYGEDKVSHESHY
jgi:DNA polymerase-3 subunit alpha